MLSICIIAQNAYGAFSGFQGGHIGGIELQTSLMARYLMNRGHSVTVLTWDSGGGREEIIDGIKILKICRQNEGIPGLRFIYPKWVRLIALLNKVNADIYYQNGADSATGQVALWCQRHKRPFIFVLASDMDCLKTLPEIDSIHERILYRYGLKHATAVVAQTNRQQQMVKQNFKVDSIKIPMPCAIGPKNDKPFRFEPESQTILWVGRICKVKRPDLFLDLAEMNKKISFEIVGPVFEDKYAQEVYNRGKLISNVSFHGRVDREKINDFYRKAACLCCTSEIEGFPNTFLEAWSWGLPLITTFDPDNIVRDQQLGFVADDIHQLNDSLRMLLSDNKMYATASKNAYIYFQNNHMAGNVVKKFEDLFFETLEKGRHVSI